MNKINKNNINEISFDQTYDKFYNQLFTQLSITVSDNIWFKIGDRTWTPINNQIEDQFYEKNK